MSSGRTNAVSGKMKPVYGLLSPGDINIYPKDEGSEYSFTVSLPTDIKELYGLAVCFRFYVQGRHEAGVAVYPGAQGYPSEDAGATPNTSKIWSFAPLGISNKYEGMSTSYTDLSISNNNISFDLDIWTDSNNTTVTVAQGAYYYLPDG